MRSFELVMLWCLQKLLNMIGIIAERVESLEPILALRHLYAHQDLASPGSSMVAHVFGKNLSTGP